MPPWMKKAYQRYVISLRKDTDSELIRLVKDLKECGTGTTDIFRQALKALQELDR